MAEKKKKTDENSSKKKGKETSFYRKTINFIKDDRFKAALAIIIFLFSAFLLFAFISYLFTWKTDQSKLSVSWLSLLSDANITVDNWAGKTGAFCSHVFIHNWFGVASFSLVWIFIITGLRLLKVKTLPLLKTIKLSLLVTIWLLNC